MSDSYSPSSWQEPYQRALTETDEKKLTELIHATEGAMFLRWQNWPTPRTIVTKSLRWKRLARRCSLSRSQAWLAGVPQMRFGCRCTSFRAVRLIAFVLYGAS